MINLVISQKEVDAGVFTFCCTKCAVNCDVSITRDVRSFSLRCVCKEMYTVKVSSRLSQRQIVNGNGVISYHKKLLECKIVDISHGGLGIILYEKPSDFVLGKTIAIKYIIGRHTYRDEFIVVSIVGDRVGVQYADGKNYTPVQRSLMQKNPA